MPKAQATLEYLFLLGAVLLSFSMLVPLLQRAYALSFFTADVGNARGFVGEMQLKVNELDFLANGSFFHVRANPVGEWLIWAEGSTLHLAVKSEPLQSEKLFLVEFPNEVHFPETRLEGETVFLLMKKDNALLIENAQ
jgi:hypothetical protein